MSGKTARKQRQAPARVPPPPVGKPGARRASPRVLIGVGAAIVAVVVAIVLAVSLSGGGSSTPNAPAVGSLTNALPGAAAVQRMFNGIPQSSNTLGAPNAPVTMAEYVDLQCPYCQEFETTVLPKLLRQYVRTGHVRIEQRLLAFIGPDSVRGRSAALAAGIQNRQFNFTELLYANQGTENTGWLDEKMVVAAAASIPGLRVPQMLSDAKSPQVADKAKGFDDEATASGVSSTPTILVGKTGGKLTTVTMSSPTDYESVSAAITNALG
jgi:protein-disulfide isomerase